VTQNLALLAGFNKICWYYSAGAYFFGPPDMRRRHCVELQATSSER